MKDLSGDDIKGTFYSDELQIVSKPDDALFDIERIVKTKKRAGKVEYPEDSVVADAEGFHVVCRGNNDSGTRTALHVCVWLTACTGSVAKNNKLLARHGL